MALDRPDRRLERGEVEPFDERPHEASPAVGRQEALEVARPEGDLVALRALEAGPAATLCLFHRRLGGREVEQLIHVRDRTGTRPSGESPSRKIHSLSAVPGPERVVARPIGVDAGLE